MNDNITNISAAAYEDIKSYIISRWLTIELLDNNDVSIIKLTTDDNRVNWVQESNSNTVSLEIVLTGSDSEIVSSLPITISKSRVLKVNAIMDEKLLPYNNFVLPLSTSQVTISHQIELPYIPVPDTEEIA